MDKKIRQLLRERSLSEQILDSTIEGMRALPFHLCFVKIPVTAGRTQIVANEQMALVKTMPRFAPACFASKTEDYKDIREATTEQVPVFINSPGSQNAVNYQKMADEFITKFPHE